MNALDLMNSLSVIYDPRQAWKVEHKLTDVLILIICAVIAGCEGWEESWGQKAGKLGSGLSLCK